MYLVIMEGITGEYTQEYKSKKKANKAAENIKMLGYTVRIEKQ